MSTLAAQGFCAGTRFVNGKDIVEVARKGFLLMRPVTVFLLAKRAVALVLMLLLGSCEKPVDRAFAGAKEQAERGREETTRGEDQDVANTSLEEYAECVRECKMVEDKGRVIHYSGEIPVLIRPGLAGAMGQCIAEMRMGKNVSLRIYEYNSLDRAFPAGVGDEMTLLGPGSVILSQERIIRCDDDSAELCPGRKGEKYIELMHIENGRIASHGFEAYYLDATSSVHGDIVVHDHPRDDGMGRTIPLVAELRVIGFLRSSPGWYEVQSKDGHRGWHEVIRRGGFTDGALMEGYSLGFLDRTVSQ